MKTGFQMAASPSPKVTWLSVSRKLTDVINYIYTGKKQSSNAFVLTSLPTRAHTPSTDSLWPAATWNAAALLRPQIWAERRSENPERISAEDRDRDAINRHKQHFRPKTGLTAQRHAASEGGGGDVSPRSDTLIPQEAVAFSRDLARRSETFRSAFSGVSPLNGLQ